MAIPVVLQLRTPALTPLEQVDQTYGAALSDLSNGANRLPPKIWPGKTLAADMADYDDLLYQMQGDCNGLKSDYATMRSWKLPAKTKSAMAQTDQLCADLLGVLKYSQDVYHAAHNYLFQDMSAWPDASQNFDYLSRLNATHKAATTAKSSLQAVFTGATDDPALQELVATVDSTITLADKAQQALDAKDTAAANDIGQQLTKKLENDKTEFLNARSYFWTNTIQVGKLRHAITALESAFQPESAAKQ
jgi:hypothetical protein